MSDRALLAQILVDGGFPSVWKDSNGAISYFDKGNFPSLKSLIEACGAGFVCLYAPSWTDPGGREVWVADSIFTTEGCGDTPEEAVARLYLALKQRDQIISIEHQSWEGSASR